MTEETYGQTTERTENESATREEYQSFFTRNLNVESIIRELASPDWLPNLWLSSSTLLQKPKIQVKIRIFNTDDK